MVDETALRLMPAMQHSLLSYPCLHALIPDTPDQGKKFRVPGSMKVVEFFFFFFGLNLHFQRPRHYAHL